ncbi:guanylate-binding protein 2-like [Orycteropus afer afer]|uniref:Guanylate-binding protein 2-like n=1 Tax=Orycteropus afer afer TaxID=1230840 RepID=A0A8B7B006_ORYAF|nr:guanylate-binding protein 2-like [Orycteropus afer afer]
MASAINMPGPVCLIENINGKLLANEEALKILSTIKQPVVVVAIVGLYRTGKSYLMNKLAGKKKGFSLGSTVQSHTKGIWMWCVPHPNVSSHTLVLLDTEGLGDVEKGDNQNDSWIFALAILLSSTFVYNSMGTINQQAMDQLHYVTELTDRIRAKSSPGNSEVDDSADFVSFFPAFVWTLRDFSLELEADGKPITVDEYLELSLKLKQGTDKKVKNFNEPRLCIRKFFPKKKCFIFDRPAQRKYLVRLEQLQEEEMNSEFPEQVAEFCSYIFSHSKAKTLSGGIIVNGPHATVHARETFPNSLCVVNIFLIVYFTICATFSQDKLQAKQEDYCKQNVQASTDYCKVLLQEIFEPLEDDVKQGLFSKAGGYHIFIQKKRKLKNKYNEIPRKGVQAEEELKKYLEMKEEVADTLLKTDQSLTEKEKEIEVERAKAEAAEAANKMLEELQRKNEQMMEQKERSYQEHVRQLTEKVERDRAQLLKEQERTIALKLREQEKFLKEGFENESKKMQREIQDIQRRNEPSGPCSIL